MKKIVIAYDFLLGLGGLERVMEFQARSLSRENNVKVSFASVNKDVSEELFSGLEVVEHSSSILSKNFLKIMYSFVNHSVFKKFKDVDCFISHSYICSRLCSHIKKISGVPYAVYIHHPPNFLYLKGKKTKYLGSDIGRGIALLAGIIMGPILRIDDKKCIKNADKVLVNSLYTKGRIDNIYSVNSLVCYPPVSSMFKVLDRRKTRYVNKKYSINNKFIFCHGRLIPDKMYELLVDAMSHIKDENLVLVFSGKIAESYKIKLLELAKRIGMKNKIKFLGYIPDNDLVALYNEAEVFAFPSIKEDFGLVPVEAMACGCPVVAWDDGAGPSEIVVNGVNGYLAKPYDTKAFAEKIEKIMAEKFKEKNKDRIVHSTKRFSEREHSRIIKETVNSLLRK